MCLFDIKGNISCVDLCRVQYSLQCSKEGTFQANAASLRQSNAGLVSARIYHSQNKNKGFDTGCLVCARLSERSRMEIQEGVHVAAEAQLVWEERKRLEHIHPKACCPTCLYTHFVSAMCSFAYLVHSNGSTVFFFFRPGYYHWYPESIRFDVLQPCSIRFRLNSILYLFIYKYLCNNTSFSGILQTLSDNYYAEFVYMTTKIPYLGIIW